jgi:hypothetical protein
MGFRLPGRVAEADLILRTCVTGPPLLCSCFFAMGLQLVITTSSSCLIASRACSRLESRLMPSLSSSRKILSYFVLVCRACAITARVTFRSSPSIEVRPTRPLPFSNPCFKTSLAMLWGIRGKRRRSVALAVAISFRSFESTTFSRSGAEAMALAVTVLKTSYGQCRPRRSCDCSSYRISEFHLGASSTLEAYVDNIDDATALSSKSSTRYRE